MADQKQGSHIAKMYHTQYAHDVSGTGTDAGYYPGPAVKWLSEPDGHGYIAKVQ